MLRGWKRHKSFKEDKLDYRERNVPAYWSFEGWPLTPHQCSLPAAKGTLL